MRLPDAAPAIAFIPAPEPALSMRNCPECQTTWYGTPDDFCWLNILHKGKDGPIRNVASRVKHSQQYGPLYEEFV